MVDGVNFQTNKDIYAEDPKLTSTEDSDAQAQSLEGSEKPAAVADKKESKFKTLFNNFQESIHTGLSNLADKLRNKETNSTLMKLAQNIDKENIPSKIMERVAEVREKFNTSGKVGEVVGKAMKTMYSLAEQIAPYPLSEVVSAIESVIPASSVETVINNQLNILEKQFFDKLEDNEKVKEFKSKFIKTISSENILNTVNSRAVDFLDTMSALTDKEGGIKEAINVAKEHAKKRINNEDNNFYLESLAKDAVTQVAPEVIKQVGPYAKAAISDEGTQAAVKSSIKALPGAAATIFGAAKTALGMVLSKFGV